MADANTAMPVVVQTPEFIAYAMTKVEPALVNQAVSQAIELAEMLLGYRPEGLTFKPSAKQAGNNQTYVMIVCDVEPADGFVLKEGSPYESVQDFLSELSLMLRDTGVEARELGSRAVPVGDQIHILPP